MKIKIPTFLEGEFREVEVPDAVMDECGEDGDFWPMEHWLQDKYGSQMPLGEHIIESYKYYYITLTVRFRDQPEVRIKVHERR